MSWITIDKASERCAVSLNTMVNFMKKHHIQKQPYSYNGAPSYKWNWNSILAAIEKLRQDYLDKHNSSGKHLSNAMIDFSAINELYSPLSVLVQSKINKSESEIKGLVAQGDLVCIDFGSGHYRFLVNDVLDYEKKH